MSPFINGKYGTYGFVFAPTPFKYRGLARAKDLSINAVCNHEHSTDTAAINCGRNMARTADKDQWGKEPLPREDPPARETSPLDQRTNMDDSITLPDTTLEPGCYVDGWRGQYAVAAMLSIASAYGFKGSDNPEDQRLIVIADYAAANLKWPEGEQQDDQEYLFELADEAELWMNEFVAPKELVFFWSDGDFMLARSCKDGRDYCEDSIHEDGGWSCQFD